MIRSKQWFSIDILLRLSELESYRISNMLSVFIFVRSLYVLSNMSRVAVAYQKDTAPLMRSTAFYLSISSTMLVTFFMAVIIPGESHSRAADPYHVICLTRPVEGRRGHLSLTLLFAAHNSPSSLYRLSSVKR